MTAPVNLHDRFFRHAFSRREVSQPFFERYLPAEVVALLDFATLTLAKDSFVDDDLTTQHSDLLFEIQTLDGRPARLYLLLEHKSYSDPWVGLQLLGYLVRIWEREKQRLKSPPLPAVFPMVLYHGERRWSAATDFSALIDAPEALTVFTPRFDYGLCDLNRDQLKGLQERAWLAVSLHVLKYVRSETLPARLPEILALFQRLFEQRDEGLAFLETVLRYLAQAAGHLDEPLLRAALIQALPADVGETVMPTLAETWVEQGVEQGSLAHARQTLRRQLAQRFGSLPLSIDERIERADQVTLDAWLDRVLDAASLDAVFVEP